MHKNAFLPILIIASLLNACQHTETPPSYEPMDYLIFMGDKEAGFFKSSLDAENNYQYVMEFNDRGRGPHLEESIQLDEQGNIIELSIQGHNYLKDTVNETFSLTNGLAKWQSSSEAGEKASVKQAFFVAVNSTFGSTELMARHLLEAPDQSIALLPSGTAKITKTIPLELAGAKKVRMLEISGMAFTPSYIWLDEDGRFFASVSTWLSCIPKDYEDSRAQLLEIQTEQELAFYNNLAKEHTTDPGKPLLIKNARVFNPKTGEVSVSQSLVLEGNKISQIMDTGTEPTGDFETIDASGKTLMPGLFDMHGHLFRPDGILDIAAGVTSVRDLANSLDLLNIKREFDEGEAIGPRILIMCGFIDQAGPYAGPIGKIVETLEEGLEAVSFYQEKGYQQIKLYSSIDPAWVAPLTKKAHDLGMRVSGHIPAYMIAEDAVKDGYDEIQHVNMIALNFLPDTIDTRTPLRFSMVAEHTHQLDIDGPDFQRLVQLLQNKEIVVDPTVSIFEGMFTTEAGTPDPSFASIIDRLPVQVQRGFYSGGLPIPEGKKEQYQASYQRLLDIIQALYANGITIVPGTDAMAGFALHRELENYVRAGIPPKEVLKMATYTSAHVVGWADQLGSVEAGMLADLILVDGRPDENISDIRRVALTIKDGKLYYPEKLYKAIGVQHYQ